MKKSLWIYAGIVVLCLILVGLAFLIPATGYQEYNMTPLRVHIRAGASVLAGALAICAAIWFFSSLSKFQAAFKSAYRLLTWGALLFSLSILQLSVLGVFNWWNCWYANTGLLILPFVAAALMMYGGLWKFARILNMRTKDTSWWLVIIVSIVFTVVSALIIKPLARYPFDGIESYNATVGWGIIYLGSGAILAWHIQRIIGQSYKNSMRWMGIALSSYALSAVHEYTINFFVWNNGPYFQWGFQMIVWVITGFLYLEAARRFYLLTASAPAYTGEGQKAKVVDHDYIDSIIEVAGLASRPDDIDPILDDMRLITATHDEPEIKLSEPERKRLTSVYERLEGYLLAKDPVRHFTQEEIREHTRPAFRALLAANTGNARINS